MPTATEVEKRVAVIFTALPVEYNAVRSHLKCLEEKVHPQGTIYEQGIFPSNGQSWDVGIAEIGEGNEQAALEVERAIQYFNPRIILFVGVAGGVKDVKLGDVVVASKVYGYESGKAGETFKPRPEVGSPNYKLISRARAEAKKDDWLQRLCELVPDPHPVVYVKPIAAGSKVINSTKSTVYEFIKSYYEDTLAVEMEGYGFLKAAYANPDVYALVIRGISDLIDGKEAADKTGTQEKASRHASAFAFEVMAKLYNEPIVSEQHKHTEESSPEKNAVSGKNVQNTEAYKPQEECEIHNTSTSQSMGNVFSLPNGITEIRKFRGDRITGILVNETPVSLLGEAKIVLHLIPLSSISSGKTHDMSKLPFDPLKMRPFSSLGWNGKHNMDGFLTYSMYNDKASSYVQLFRNGILEAVESSLLKRSNYIPCIAFEEVIMCAFKHYISHLEALNVGMPIFAFLTFVGVKGYSMTSDPSWIFEGGTIEKDVLLLPEIIIENYDFDVEKNLKPWFDMVWNACGFPGSKNFDSSGKWTDKARY